MRTRHHGGHGTDWQWQTMRAVVLDRDHGACHHCHRHADRIERTQPSGRFDASGYAPVCDRCQRQGGTPLRR